VVRWDDPVSLVTGSSKRKHPTQKLPATEPFSMLNAYAASRDGAKPPVLPVGYTNQVVVTAAPLPDCLLLFEPAIPPDIRFR
jgi:hypothetical protein